MKQILILLILILNTKIVFSQGFFSGKTNIAPSEPAIQENTNINQEPSPGQSNQPAAPGPASEQYIITTNEILFSTNKVVITNVKTDYFVNWGFYFLLEDKKFADKFSRGTFDNDKPFYHVPFNSWNDNFYFVLSYDWKLGFLNSLNTRWGWSLDINLAGSGAGGDAVKVDPGTDLGKIYGSAKGFYLSYNDYKFPFMLNIRFQPLSLSIFNFYMGGGGGVSFHIITYNELEGEQASQLEENEKKTFFPIYPVFKIFLGVSFKITEELQETFFEIGYRFTNNPIVTGDFQIYDSATKAALSGHKTSVSFQASGLFMGFGFRF